MANNIVTVNITVNSAPTPSGLQKKGALISQGGTTLTAGTSSLLTQLSDLTPLLTGALAITSITWASNVATVTTTAPHGIPAGDTVPVVIAGATPTAYNGAYQATYVSASVFTYPLTPNPGTSPASTPGTWTPADVSELLAMATTFFAQGGATAVSVLELGEGTPAQGVTALTTLLTANPNLFYSYLVPREWAAESTFISYVANFESTTAKTYFFVTCTTGNYTGYTQAMKCVFTLIEAPGIPSTEFSCAAPFYVTLNYTPSPANKVTPTAFSFLYGVTAYPTFNNSAILATLKAANVNVVGTGAEGGLTNTILFWGRLMDGNDFTFWYSVDWVQINIDNDIANAIINGSNTPANPLYYSQDGINRLQGTAANTMARGVSNGLVLGSVTQTELDQTTLFQNFNAGQYAGQAVVNAIPFLTYLAANPADFKAERYSGFTIIYSPNRGFTQVIFNVLVTDFVASAA